MNKKRRGNILLLAIVTTLLISMIATPILADDYEKQDTHSGHLVASTSNVTVGEDFYVVLWIDSGTDSVTSFTVRLLEFNTTSAGSATTSPVKLSSEP